MSEEHMKIDAAPVSPYVCWLFRGISYISAFLLWLVTHVTHMAFLQNPRRFVSS